MTIRSFDEAYRNLITNGSMPDFTCGLDNFCWPDPIKSEKNRDGDYKLGMLVETCESLYDLCLEYGVPLVSGKDSMKNDYRGKNSDGDIKISIKPTLLVTLMGKCSTDVKFTSSLSDKHQKLYLISKDMNDFVWGLAGSELDRIYNLDKTELVKSNIEGSREYYETLSKTLNSKIFNSIHDISEGGLISTLLEMCFENNRGVDLNLNNLDKHDLLTNLFAETSFSFLCGVSNDKASEFENLMKGYFLKIGDINADGIVSITQNNEKISIDVQKAHDHWSRKWF